MIAIRPAVESDRNHILATWLRTGVGGSGVPSVIWYREHERLLREVVLPRAAVRVAALEAEPAVIAGWVADEPGVLHYVHVKPRFRGNGIARMLVGRVIDAREYSHRPPEWFSVPGGWTFNPYRLWSPKQ